MIINKLAVLTHNASFLRVASLFSSPYWAHLTNDLHTAIQLAVEKVHLRILNVSLVPCSGQINLELE